MLKKVSLYVMSLFYLAAGMNHFVNPQTYRPMFPPYLPAPEVLNLLSGAAEMIAAALLMRPEARTIGAWSVILLLIAVFPANIYMATQGGAAFGVPDWVLIARLPMQLLLIAWAYYHTKNSDLDRYVIEAETVIEAPPSRVWGVLTKFSDYPAWNPYIVEAKGDSSVGGQMEIRLHTPGSEPVLFQNKVLENRANQILSWRGSFIVRGLLDGTHAFRLEKTADDKTRFVQSEMFEGLLVGSLKGLFGRREDGFRKMNAALKVKAEKT